MQPIITSDNLQRLFSFVPVDTSRLRWDSAAPNGEMEKNSCKVAH